MCGIPSEIWWLKRLTDRWMRTHNSFTLGSQQVHMHTISLSLSHPHTHMHTEQLSEAGRVKRWLISPVTCSGHHTFSSARLNNNPAILTLSRWLRCWSEPVVDIIHYIPLSSLPDTHIHTVSRSPLLPQLRATRNCHLALMTATTMCVTGLLSVYILVALSHVIPQLHPSRPCLLSINYIKCEPPP